MAELSIPEKRTTDFRQGAVIMKLNQLQQNMLDQIESDIVEYIKRYFTARFSALGTEGHRARTVIRRAMKKAIKGE